MHTDFGFDRTSRSTRWNDIKAGPSTTAVRSHLAKLTGFRSGASR